MITVTLDNYSDIRDLTRKMSEEVQSRITAHLDVVKTHFRPAGSFGPYLSSGNKPSSAHEISKSASTAYTQFTAFFKQIAVSAPLNLDPTLSDATDLNSATPVLFPLVYQHDISTPQGTKGFTVTAPFRFVLAFPEYPFSGLRSLVSSRGPKDKLREFVLHYAVLNYMVMQNKRLLGLFDDLRFPIRSERFAEFGVLPITMIAAPAGSVRPPDAIVEKICKFSGTDTAEELIDFESWNNLLDPLAARFQEEAAKYVALADDEHRKNIIKPQESGSAIEPSSFILGNQSGDTSGE